VTRSAINAIIREAEAFLASRHFLLPPFAHWTVEDWRSHRHQVGEVVDRGLGWDVTDFGSDDFASVGLCVFTMRNGDPQHLESRRGKIYAEKALIVDPSQVTPFHFHWVKTEDIINRGGGVLAIQLYNSTGVADLAPTEITVSVDAMERAVPAGGTIRLRPGESITLPPRLYHQFWADGGRVLAGEVSLVNDDHADNRFLEPAGRFPDVEDDEEPFRLLVGDYARWVTA
jgi:D-lyxose ketol-isomerase